MTRSEPTSFARQYLKQICLLGNRRKYLSDPLWTVVAKQAAVKVCKKAGLLTQHEYLRLDVCGYRKIGKYAYQNRVEVAFEVEG